MNIVKVKKDYAKTNISYQRANEGKYNQIYLAVRMNKKVKLLTGKKK
jgi:hypothetical protein